MIHILKENLPSSLVKRHYTFYDDKEKTKCWFISKDDYFAKIKKQYPDIKEIRKRKSFKRELNYKSVKIKDFRIKIKI